MAESQPASEQPVSQRPLDAVVQNMGKLGVSIDDLSDCWERVKSANEEVLNLLARAPSGDSFMDVINTQIRASTSSTDEAVTTAGQQPGHGMTPHKRAPNASDELAAARPKDGPLDELPTQSTSRGPALEGFTPAIGRVVHYCAAKGSAPTLPATITEVRDERGALNVHVLLNGPHCGTQAQFRSEEFRALTAWRSDVKHADLVQAGEQCWSVPPRV